ncbi:MAG: hypothetical protein FJ038_04860 [Chloroflexi bacterium]|nr:hypothetical protein [Chloroflexota bacterium]
MKFEASATIGRTPAEVWTYAADIPRHTEWMTVTEAVLTSGDGERAGARGRETMQLGPMRITADLEVAEAEPGRRLRWRTLPGAPFDLVVVLDLAPDGPGATRASYRSIVGLRGLWRLAAPLVAMEGREGVKRELRRLKEKVEAASVVA